MYEKPLVLGNDDLAEGVFTDSGDTCYTSEAHIHQRPETGRSDYRIQVNGQHNADHNSNAQKLILTFNQAVTYVECYMNGAAYVDGNGTTTLTINLGYWNNHTDNIGGGDVVVTSEPGLEVTGCRIEDIGKC